MKALQLNAIALCLFGIFSSCTKDTLQSSTTSSASSLDGVLGTNGRGQNDVQPTGNDKTDVSLVVIYDPAIGIKGQDVTVTGTFAETSAVPDCGQLQLEQLVNGVYVAVESPVDVSQTNHEVTYTFTPTVVGEAAYSFRVHYVASGGPGGQCNFNQKMSEGFPLTVIDACLPLDLEVADVKGIPQGSTNWYDFEVTYRVKSCPAYTGAKLQGGLTAVTNFDESDLSSTDLLADGSERKNTQNDNHIIYWFFDITSNYNNTFTVKFTKELKGDGPYQITGGWSVSAKDASGNEVRDEVEPVLFTK